MATTCEIYRKPGGTGCFRCESDAMAMANSLNQKMDSDTQKWRVSMTVPNVIWNVVRFPEIQER